MLGISEAANEIGFHSVCVRTTVDNLSLAPLPCILHWNQNHFVVLYKVRKGKRFYIADPGKGLIKYSLDDFKNHWVSTRSGGEDKGIAMLLEPTPLFYTLKADEIEEGENDNPRSFRFLFGYVRKYKRYFGQVVLGLTVGSSSCRSSPSLLSTLASEIRI